MMGLASVGMAILVSFGLCAALGVFYGPVHSILPFLLLGIGIDDMFVITQCYSNLSKEDLKRSLPIQIGTTMRHAGVSITITSITDFAAFAVGSSTVRSFSREKKYWKGFFFQNLVHSKVKIGQIWEIRSKLVNILVF